MHREKPLMNIVTSFSRRSFLWLFILTMLFAAAIDAAVYLGAGYVFTLLPLDQLRAAAADAPQLKAGFDELWPYIEWARVLFLPISIGLFFLFFLVCWLVARQILIRVIRREGVDPASLKKEKPGKTPKRKKSKPEKTDLQDMPLPDEEAAPVLSQKETEALQQRYYLHMLAVLQREGRLIDFLTEDLSPYDDSQIGAAVRSIHESCKKTLEKHLSPTSVMDKNEGEKVNVPVDFDTSAIKLTGNVTGEPPFTGTLRHRGWRAGKLDLPVLTGSGDPKIIAPAEVEV